MSAGELSWRVIGETTGRQTQLFIADPRVGEPCPVCPPYVVRCAHLEGDPRVVWLLSGGLWIAVACEAEHLARPWYSGVGVPSPSHHRAGCLKMPWDNSAHFDTRAEADAAFERYEAILLGREVGQ